MCQKKRKKRYAGGFDRRGQIVDRRSIYDRSEDVDHASNVYLLIVLTLFYVKK
ncbi:MAG: hypothetical protein KGI13_04965 [Betaproteobacteria bacterium]|nr:hypothetical protein [Betaproteobacteria bacterium]